MYNRFITTVMAGVVALTVTSCSTQFLNTKTKGDDVARDVGGEVAEVLEQPADSPVVEKEPVSEFPREEALLEDIIVFYNEAIAAIDDGDYGLAETKIDSAAVLSADVNFEAITDESLSRRYTTTFASLFQQYGKIFSDVDTINQEDPTKWLDELVETDPEQFKNGKWKDDELRKIVQKIALRCDVPIDYNEQVKKAIYFFQTVKKKEMMKWQRRSGRYLPMIYRIFEEEDIPMDIAYLSMIESGFSSRAYSRARASGLWQFIYSTGRLYGLKRTQWYDERRDPEKSTRAAAKHLKDLYKMYGDWRLVMAAYNWGPTRVTRQVRAGNDNFWTMTMPRETRNYVPSFMAAVVISKAPELFGFENIEYEPPFEYDSVDVKYTNLSTAAKCAGVNVSVLKDMNTELLKSYTPSSETYALKIPKGSKEKFLVAYNQIPKEKYVQPHLGSYVVRRGDTLSGIAGRFKVSVNSLMIANNIRNPRRLAIGQRLKIPGHTSSSSSSSTASRKTVTNKVSSAQVAAAKKNTKTYTVRRNDNLWLIAERNNTSIGMIQALNNMGSSSRIMPGQKLKVPAAPTKLAQADTGSVKSSSTRTARSSREVKYTIRKNDTLYEIAKKYKVSYKDIMKWNKIKNHRTIKPGQEIVIRTQ